MAAPWTPTFARVSIELDNYALKSDVKLRQGGNKLIDEGFLARSLGDWKMHAIQQGYISLSTNPKCKSGTGKEGIVVPFELLINVEMYEARVELNGHDSSHSSLSINKRRERSASSTFNPANGKQPRLSSSSTAPSIPGSVLPSRLPGRSLRVQVMNTQSKVEMKKIKCNVLNDQGETVFEGAEQQAVYLADLPFANGTMKCTFDLTIPSESSTRFVAKHFFRLADDGLAIEHLPSAEIARLPLPDVKEHNNFIQAEVIRLLLSQRYLDQFYKHCKVQGIDVFEYFQFATAFLLQEIGVPSSASGVPEPPFDFYDDVPFDTRIMWLVEKRHPGQSIIRFNGTLNHSSAVQDIKYLTIYAFCHYVYGFTQGKLVLADIQGTPQSFRSNDGDVDGITLFDPMTHTSTGDSGIGDFGTSSISRFVEDHVCQDICRQLRLDEAAPLQHPQSPAKDDPSKGKEKDVDDTDSELSDSGEGAGNGNNSE
ncbi:kinase-like domain-containing protein [Coprinopsis sp. MPI-PUGE-AT-0042]|nr:kinase-like domain-containing protein [Coprinopsis sp. MPI-PUGE-AT-0042]